MFRVVLAHSKAFLHEHRPGYADLVGDAVHTCTGVTVSVSRCKAAQAKAMSRRPCLTWSLFIPKALFHELIADLAHQPYADQRPCMHQNTLNVILWLIA